MLKGSHFYLRHKAANHLITRFAVLFLCVTHRGYMHMHIHIYAMTKPFFTCSMWSFICWFPFPVLSSLRCTPICSTLLPAHLRPAQAEWRKRRQWYKAHLHVSYGIRNRIIFGVPLSAEYLCMDRDSDFMNKPHKTFALASGTRNLVWLLG